MKCRLYLKEAIPRKFNQIPIMTFNQFTKKRKRKENKNFKIDIT